MNEIKLELLHEIGGIKTIAVEQAWTQLDLGFSKGYMEFYFFPLSGLGKPWIEQESLLSASNLARRSRRWLKNIQTNGSDIMEAPFFNLCVFGHYGLFL